MNVENKRRFRCSYIAGDWNSLIDVVGNIPKNYEESDKTTQKVKDDDIDKLVDLVNSTDKKVDKVGATNDEDWCVVEAEEAEGLEADQGSKTQFDLILTAETCYTEVSCQQVAQHLLDLLIPDLSTSVGLVASKRFYFGTGGSAAYFRECCVNLSKSDNSAKCTLVVEVVEVIDDGKSNIREIMLVRKVSKS
jgi:hypothetical protein